MAHPTMYDDADPILGRLRGLALALPGAEEKPSHGRPTFRVGKIFATYGGSVRLAPGDHERHDTGLIFAPDPAERVALEEDPRIWVPAYYGPYGWLGIDLPGPDDDGWDEIGELLDASYRCVAPKRRIAELDA